MAAEPTDDRYAALYVRVSSAKQLDNWSVQAQRGLERLGRERGLRVVVVDGDLGISGETIESRPAMTGLLKEVQAGRVAAIICADWNRLSRDQDLIDGLRIKKACKDAGCVIITPGKTFDFASESDELLGVLEQMFSANQNQKRAKATTQGQYEKARAAGWPGGPVPFGYRAVYDVPHRDGRPRGRLVVDPTEAEAVRRCYALYADGVTAPDGRWRPLSFEGVARQLTADGYRFTRRQSRADRDAGSARVTRTWGVKDVTRVLAGPQRRRYLGYHLWGQGGVSKWVRAGGPVEAPAPELRIVDTALFLRAEALRQRRRQQPARLAAPTLPLQGLLRCPHCGGRTTAHRMRRSTPAGTRETVEYLCLRFRHYGAAPEDGCPAGGYYLQQTSGMRAVTALLTEGFAQRRVDDAIAQAAAEERAQHDDGQRRAVREALDDVGLRETRLKEAVEAGLYTLADLRERKDALDAERQRLTRRLEGLTRSRHTADELDAAVASLRRMGSVGATLAWLGEADPARYRAFVGLLLESVTVVASGPATYRRAEVVGYALTAAGRELLGDPGDAAPESTFAPGALTQGAKVRPLPRPFLLALRALAPPAAPA